MKITKDRIIFLIIASVILSIISAVSTYATNYLFNSNEVSYNNNSSGIASDNVQGAIDKLYEEATNYSDMRKLIYPVGSIYISVTDDTVAKVEARYGGTWEVFGAGRTIIGVGTGTDANSTSKTFAINETSGEYSHKLTSAESGMPNHSHKIYSRNGATTGSYYGGPPTSSNSGTAQYNSGVVQDSGALNASNFHNNIQPYITVYMYKRVS